MSEERGRSSYLDLLITTLMEHEKNLDKLVERLEKICEDVARAIKEVARNKAAVPDSDTLVYIRVTLDRPVDEVVKIIESLKDT